MQSKWLARPICTFNQPPKPTCSHRQALQKPHLLGKSRRQLAGRQLVLAPYGFRTAHLLALKARRQQHISATPRSMPTAT